MVPVNASLCTSRQLLIYIYKPQNLQLLFCYLTQSDIRLTSRRLKYRQFSSSVVKVTVEEYRALKNICSWLDGLMVRQVHKCKRVAFNKGIHSCFFFTHSFLGDIELEVLLRLFIKSCFDEGYHVSSMFCFPRSIVLQIKVFT